MCIAIVQKPGATVSKLNLWAGWVNNGHGGGFAYVHEGKVHVKKGFMKYNDFETALEKAVDKFGSTSSFLIHMRIMTSGGITAKNCHPFRIRGGAMIHNGTLFYPTGDAAQNGKSDTRMFAEKFHNILALEDVLRTEKDMLYAFGHHNKLAFLYDNGEYVIMNEKAGHWQDGVWFSNRSCQVKVTSSPPLE